MKVLALFLLNLFIIFAIGFGYIGNIVKLVNCDGEKPYTEEIVRTIGVFVPPVGIAAGYMTIGGEND